VPGAVEPLLDALDSRRGVLLASSYEYPGRYTRWDMGFVDPPLECSSRSREFTIRALNERGRVLLGAVERAIGASDAVLSSTRDDDAVRGTVRESTDRVPEEQRSKQPTMFSVVRALMELFASDEDEHLGLYGSFGYDLALQFEPYRPRCSSSSDANSSMSALTTENIVG